MAHPSRVPSLTVAVCLLLSSLALGCGKTNRKVIEEKTPAFAEMRKKLAALVEELPEPGSPSTH